jgi:hypothetical protein
LGDICHYSIKKFHALFSPRQIILLFYADNEDKKYYNEGNISPSMAIIAITVVSLFASIHKNLQRQGYELLSLYFNRTEDQMQRQCPFNR